jgi:uncharacterized integral membrane protein
MLKASRGLLVLMVVFVFVVVLAFVLDNQQEVSLSFLGLGTAQLPVSVFIVLAVLVGMLAGPLIALLVRFKRRFD